MSTETEHTDENERDPETAELEAESEAVEETVTVPETDPAEEAAKLKDQLLRALAEVENTKKRAVRDVKDAREYAVTGFARDMLDIADNLARALGSLDEEAKTAGGDALAGLVEGVQMTERRLDAAMQRHGVKKVEPAPGEALDPNKHQAAAQIPANQPKGTIAEVMQPGYIIGERTLRAAMVVVSAGPAETPTPPPNEDEAGSNLDISA